MNQTLSEKPPILNRQINKSAPRWFILSAGTILAITGIAKFWSGFGNSQFLSVVDPIIRITFGQLILAAAIVEIVRGQY